MNNEYRSLSPAGRGALKRDFFSSISPVPPSDIHLYILMSDDLVMYFAMYFTIPVKHGLLRFAPAILQGMRNPLIYSLCS